MLNFDYIKNRITNGALYIESHNGSLDGNLGLGMFYYSLAYSLNAKTCVCLGSGGGYVPRLMRQAQVDLGIQNESETYLVDADLVTQFWGEPYYYDHPECAFIQYFDVKLIKMLTKDAVVNFKDKKIDYLHIDADHSYEHVKEDFELYSECMSESFTITLHDTHTLIAGVGQFIKELRQSSKYDIVDFNLGAGTALVRKR